MWNFKRIHKPWTVMPQAFRDYKGSSDFTLIWTIPCKWNDHNPIKSSRIGDFRKPSHQDCHSLLGWEAEAGSRGDQNFLLEKVHWCSKSRGLYVCRAKKVEVEGKRWGWWSKKRISWRVKVFRKLSNHRQCNVMIEYGNSGQDELKLDPELETNCKEDSDSDVEFF